MGMLASASVGDGTGFYEPIHGSAHDIAGQDKANPLASILSAALLLDIGLGLVEEAEEVRDAVAHTLKEGWRTIDIANNATPEEKKIGTKQMGEFVLEQLKK